MLKTLIFIFSIWIMFAIIIPILTMPNHLLIKTPIPKNKEIAKIIRKLKSRKKEETLENVYNFIIKNYVGEKQKYKLSIYPNLYSSNIKKFLKNKKSFLACHQQNFLLKTLLINTNQFKENQIKEKYNITKFLTIHQYLEIKIGKEKYKVDPFFKIFKKFPILN